MTLGCGGYGGNITKDNISPRHLLNIKARRVRGHAGDRSNACATGVLGLRFPRARRPPKAGVGEAGGDNFGRENDQFLPGGARVPVAAGRLVSPPLVSKASEGRAPAPVVDKPADFVCEDDVGQRV